MERRRKGEDEKEQIEERRGTWKGERERRGRKGENRKKNGEREE